MKKLFLLLPVLLALAFLPVPSPMAADDHASARDKTFEYGSYKCADDDNPGAFVFAYDGTGLFATEEYIAYFDWKVEGKNLLLTFLSGKQEDKTLKMAILDPSSFKFEKYVYKRYKKGKLDKYKLVADSKEGFCWYLPISHPERAFSASCTSMSATTGKTGFAKWKWPARKKAKILSARIISTNAKNPAR